MTEASIHTVTSDNADSDSFESRSWSRYARSTSRARRPFSETAIVAAAALFASCSLATWWLDDHPQVAFSISNSLAQWVVRSPHSRGQSTSSQRVFSLADTVNDDSSSIDQAGLIVHLDHRSPLAAALETPVAAPNQEFAATGTALSERATALSAGEQSLEPTITALESEIRQESAESVALREHQRTEQMVFDQAATSALRSILPTPTSVVAPAAATAEPMPAAQAEAVAALPSPLAPESVAISLSDLNISRDELIESLFMPIVAPVVADSGEASSLGASSAGRSGSLASSGDLGRRYAIADHLGSSPSTQALPNNRSLPFQSTALKQPNVVRDNVSAQAISAMQSASLLSAKPAQQLVLDGPIQLRGGLALTDPSDQVVVYREVDSEPSDQGVVQIRQGRYQIFITEAKGLLVGELRSKDGEILGRGEFDLSQLRISASQNRLSGIDLDIAPTPRGFSGEVAAEPNQPDASELTGVRVGFHDTAILVPVDRDRKFHDTSFAQGSMVLAETSAAQHLTTLSMISTGHRANLTVTPEKVIESLGKLMNPHLAGYVLGRVTFNGQPVAGAQVEFMTADDPPRAVYFNDALQPDLSMRATGKNGLYAFTNVASGTQAVQAHFGELASDPKIFLVERGKLSRVDMNAGQDRSAKLQTYDAFRTDWPVPAIVSQPGDMRVTSIDSSGVGRLSYSSGNSLLILDAQAPQGYERMRVCRSRLDTLVPIPMIPTQWLDQVRGSARVNSTTSTGTVVGFIQSSQDYHAWLMSTQASHEYQVVYFDSAGNATRSPTGQPGGGFIAFNIPAGFQTFTIESPNLTSQFAATMLVEPGVVNVFTQSIH